MNKYARVAIKDFTNKIDHRTNAYKRRLETMKGKSKIAIDMVKRAVKSGIYADYLLVDSWYSKPVFIKEMNVLGLKVISRMANNNKIWNFIGKEKTLETIYNRFKEIKTAKPGTHVKKIKFTYFSATVEHKTADRLKIVFIKTKEKLIPIVSTTWISVMRRSSISTNEDGTLNRGIKNSESTLDLAKRRTESMKH